MKPDFTFRRFLLGISFLGCIQFSYGAEFFRKQSGTTTIATGSTSRTIAITAVDLSKSFLVFSATLNDNSTTNFQIGGEITNTTTLTFERTGNTGTVSISWQVFEFESGVYVQHGSSTNIARGAPVNVAINCVDLTKSFVLISARKSGGQFGADDGITANLTTSTNLQFFISSNGPGGANMEEAYWQIIEYQGAIVKKLVTTLSAGSTSTTSTISPAITNLSKAFVVSNHWLDGDINSDDLPRTELTNTTTVTYTRVGTTANMNFVTYVIEFTDGSTVTRGVQNFGTGVLTQPVSITSSISSGVFGSGNFGRQGSTSFATDDNPGHNWFTYEITSSTNLQITRAVGTGSAADAPFQIVTFDDSGLQTNTFYSIASGAWETNTNWSYTPDGSSGAVPTGVYPRRTNNVVIQNGHSITVNSVTDNNPCSQSPTGLGLGNVGAFTGSTDQMFYHTGDIIISNGGTLTATEEVMLEGYTLIESGGTFTINEDIVNLGFLEVSNGATFNNTDDLILSGNSITIINNTSSSLDDIYIDHTDARLCGSGAFNIGGDPDPTVQYLNGATSAQICSSFPITCTDTTPPCVPFTPPSGSFSFGNMGPGGVENTDGTGGLVLWLDANTINQTDGTNVTTWLDQSGYGNDAIAPGGNEPVFNTNQLNGFPDVHFTAANSDFFAVADDNSLDPTTISIFAVGNHTASSGGFAGYISKIRVGVDPFDGYALVRNGATSNIAFTLDALANAVVGTSAYATNTILEGVYDQTNIQLFHNETSQGTDAYASNIVAHNNALYLGAIADPDGTPIGTGVTGFLDGDIAEGIVIGRAVNNAERIIIANYLSAKYNIGIAVASDVYDMDDLANGNYDFEVAGIGQTAASINHRDAKGTGIVRMWNPSALGNGDFLLWGHDNGALTSSADVDGVVIEERFTRIWRVSETADVGTVRVSFDFNGIGNPLGSNLRLLIDRDMDFSTNDVTPIVGTVSGNIVVFSGVNFQDGDRFTLGNTDASIPLPVELLTFEALALEHSVQIRWSTASELNNDYFSVQRSTDAEQWTEVVRRAGAGTSELAKFYTAEDYQPLDGRSYYRLKQVDFDGMSSYSSIVAVDFSGMPGLILSPNPSSGKFTLEAGKFNESQVRVYNSLGQLLPVTPLRANNELSIDLSTYPAGIYIIRVTDGSVLRSARAVRN